jgi:peptidyl-prolyl cis-trans isomerase B (cyclophilin B)
MAKVRFNTSLGSILIELDELNTPKTTQNFLKYVDAGFYNDTIFHRVIKGFMVQGGGFDPHMMQKASQSPIQNEAKTSLKNQTGTIAMARTQDPHSASSQFFINVADNAFLDFKNETVNGYGYCAFGQVIEGMDVVMAISQVSTTQRAGHQDVPQDVIHLISAERVE